MEEERGLVTECMLNMQHNFRVQNIIPSQA